MTEVPTPAPPKSSPPPDDSRRRKKQAMFRQHMAMKTGKLAAESSTSCPLVEQESMALEEGPPMNRRGQRDSLLPLAPARRKELIAKQLAKRKKVTGSQEKDQASQPDAEENDTESLPTQEKHESPSPIPESQEEDVSEQSGAQENEFEPLERDAAANSKDVESTAEPEISPKEDRNVMKEGVEEKQTSWDTRSILEHPPEPPGVEDTPKLMRNDTEGELGMFDTAPWSSKETPFSNATNANADIEREASRLMGNDEREGMGPPAKELTSDDGDMWEATELTFGASTVEKAEDIEVDGFDNASWTMTDVAFSSMLASTVHADTTELAARLIAHHSADVDLQVDEKDTIGDPSISAAESNTPDNPLKEYEALLTSDEARSDLYGDAPDAAEGAKLMNEAAQQKRIEQYRERNDDNSSGADSGDEMLEDDSDEEDVANEEILYVSADSEDDEELQKADVGVNTITVPGTKESPLEAESIATFTAAAVAAHSADSENKRNRPKVELENLELINTNSWTSDGGKAGSTVMETSAASSALFGEGVISVAGMSVNTMASGGTAGSKGSRVGQGAFDASRVASQSLLPPPPPPPPTPNQDAKQKLLKIPPPPPEKFKKWEEEKMRPIMHLEAVARAKADSAQGSSQQADIAQKSTGQSLRFDVDSNVSVLFPTNFPSSQDGIEAELTIGLGNGGNSGLPGGGLETAVTTSIITQKDDEIEGSPEREKEKAPCTLTVSPPEAEEDRDDATSISVLSPPHVSRMPFGEATGLGPGTDGIWKDSDNLNDKNSSSREKNASPDGIATTNPRSSPTSALEKRRSPIQDSRMAERLALASFTAARKFEERYGDVDDEDIAMAKITMVEPSDRRRSTDEDVGNVDDDGPKPSSFFCGPDMLGATSMCQPGEADEVVDDEIMQHVSAQAKEWTSMNGKQKHGAVSSSPSSEIMRASFDDAHHTGLELVGGAFSTWKNSDYAYGSDVPESDAGFDKEVLKKAATAAALALSKSQEATTENPICGSEPGDVELLVSWLESDVLKLLPEGRAQNIAEFDNKVNIKGDADLPRTKMQTLLAIDENLNSLCRYVSENIALLTSSDGLSDSDLKRSKVETPKVDLQRPQLHPFFLPADISKRPRPTVLAANFVSFLNRVSLLSGIESPFKDDNPFLSDIVNASFSGTTESGKFRGEPEAGTMQVLVFTHSPGEVVGIVHFFFQACGARVGTKTDMLREKEQIEAVAAMGSKSGAGDGKVFPKEAPNLLQKVPTESPSPFETAVWNMPSIVPIVLGFLGDPVAVCRTKMVNRFCNRIIGENEHVIMRDAVRLGGLSMHVRPAFWMWITLEKCGRHMRVDRRDDATTVEEDSQQDQSLGSSRHSTADNIMLTDLEIRGREGKWHHVIQRDVSRAFGNMPPHKTGARLRTDSIVRALVTWGRGRLLMRGVKGGGVAPPTPTILPADRRKPKPKPRPATGPPPWERGDDDDQRDADLAPTETVSQWGGISPVPSFSGQSQSGVGGMEDGPLAKAMLASSIARALDQHSNGKQAKNSRAIEELALSGNALTNEIKADLQNQLGYILHALAAAHEDVGYCQGMDYVVAHLLRVLQDTVRWQSVRGTLSPAIGARPNIPESDSDAQSLSTQIDQAIDSSLVVEETVFRVMDTFFTTYNLRHMYWPELRCLKTCCRVFERLIQLKLPVLADHFSYHELNVGLFALGWFQTLFLYLPSMPSATVCHMWDIWLVERSFKIFFRVGTAILFLSQPILLNHELEGMMTYLNTFPDATLLNPDILIACALQIKVTNRMLAEIEMEVTGGR